MRKTFGIEPRYFLHFSIPEVEAMFIKTYVTTIFNALFSPNSSKNFNIPQYHILILAWCALVVLYGEASLSLIAGIDKI